MKRLLAFMLAFCMVFSILPAAAATEAAEIASGTCGDDLTWVLTDDGKLTISGTGEMSGHASIPDGAAWYEYREQILSVEIQEGVTSIGHYAFSECSSLTSVTIPASVVSIGQGAFHKCLALPQLELPAGLTEIPRNALSMCESLTELEIPASVESIGIGAFWGCSSLTQLELPEGLKEIGSSAFGNCDSLTHMTIPEGITEIPWQLFVDCYRLESVTFPSTVTTIDEGTFLSCPALKEFVIPEGVAYIPVQMFMNCYTLSSVTIPDSVTQIGAEAFKDTGKLTSLTLPDGLTSIGDQAFVDSGIQELVIPAGVSAIGAKAFYSSALETFKFLGSAPASIGTTPMLYLTATAYYPGNDASWTEEVRSSFGGTITWVDYDPAIVASGACGDDLTWVVTDDGTLTISGTGEMTSSPWRYNEDITVDIKRVVVEEGVTVISDNAFRENSALTSAVLPETLTAIGNSAFYHCDTLTEIVIPSKVASIGSNAFYNCLALTDIMFKGDAPTFGSTCFWKINATVWFPMGNETWTGDAFDHKGQENIIWAAYDPDCLESKAGTWGENSSWAFDDATGTLTFTGTGAMDAAESFSYYPWYYFSDEVTSVVIGDGITNVPEYAFYTYANLESVTLSEDVKVLEPLAFMECYSLKNFRLPAALETIGYSCFSSAGLTEIEIPETVTSIGNSAFSETALTSVTVPGGAVLGWSVFSHCHQMKTAEIMEGVTELPMSTFSGCTALETVYIPGSVTLIDMGVFSQCDSLTSIYFTGDFVTGLADWTFNGMTLTAYYPADNETWTEDKLLNYGGTLTWVPYEAEEETLVDWVSVNTSLTGSIDLNFYVVLSDNLVNEETFVRFTFNGETLDVPMKEAKTSVKNGVTRYRFSYKVYAKQMNDTVTAQVMTPDGAVGEAMPYSVAKYCYGMIDYSSNAEMVALCKAMLNYGSAAQSYLGYHEETLANALLSEADRTVSDFDPSAYAHSVAGSEEGIKASGAKLLLEDEVAIQVSFELTGSKPISDYSFTIDGEAVEYTKVANGKYYFELDGIAASRFDELHAFSVGGLTLNYGVLSYANQVYDKATASQELRGLVNALYAYYAATDAYIN